MNKLTFIV